MKKLAKLLLSLLLALPAYADTIVYTLNSTGGDSTALQDTHTVSSTPTTNFVSGTTLLLEESGSAWAWTGFLRLSDLSGIPAGSTIDGVTVSLAKQSGSNYTLNAYRNLRAAVYSELTYNIYSTGNNWGTSGGSGSGTDRSASASGSWTFWFLSDLYVDAVDGGLITDVQDWLDGAATNGGWTLLLAASTNDSIQVYSGEGTDALRPIVTVDYTPPGSAPLLKILQMSSLAPANDSVYVIPPMLARSR